MAQLRLKVRDWSAFLLTLKLNLVAQAAVTVWEEKLPEDPKG